MKFISKIVLCATLMLSAITGSQAQSTAHPLAEVFSAYFSMKDALVKDDASATSTKAKELFAAIAAVKMEAMQGNQHMTWMKFQQKLSADAEHIKGRKICARCSRFLKQKYLFIINTVRWQIMGKVQIG
jgi:hypothetical protein